MITQHAIRRSVRDAHIVSAILVALLLQACGSDPDMTRQTGVPGFTIGVGSNALSMGSGAIADSWLKITRVNGLTSAITYTVTGAPTGLTATVTPTVMADSLTLTIATAATLTTGNYPLVLVATAPSTNEQRANIVVTVTAPANTNIRAFKTVVTGFSSSCAISRTTGGAYCWGLNDRGQLGNGVTSDVNTFPIAVAGSFTFEDISISDMGHFACGIRSGGAAYCWGNNDAGQLGDGTTTAHSVPTAVAGSLRFLALTAGTDHVCGLTYQSFIYCWGNNDAGALGDGTQASHKTPALISSNFTFKRVSASNEYTCAVTTTGAAYCWGLGNVGQLGNGTITNSLTPAAVLGGLSFNSIAAGADDACALTVANAAYCWGHNTYGEVGDGTTTLRSAPVAVAGARTYSSISGGFEHFCAVAADASAIGYCWGYNVTYALGDGSNTNRSVPTSIFEALSGPFRFQYVSIGYSHGCGVTSPTGGNTNEIYCWGVNNRGERGDGTVATAAGPFEVQWPQ